jgi:excisionase family DNA binding protein
MQLRIIQSPAERGFINKTGRCDAQARRSHIATDSGAAPSGRDVACPPSSGSGASSSTPADGRLTYADSAIAVVGDPAGRGAAAVDPRGRGPPVDAHIAPRPLLRVIAELRELAGDAEPAREWLTTAGAARQLGVSVRRVIQMANTGELIAEKRGGRWLADARDVDARIASFRCLNVESDNVVSVQSL